MKIVFTIGGVFVLGEELSVHKVIGTIMVIGGIAIIEYRKIRAVKIRNNDIRIIEK